MSCDTVKKAKRNKGKMMVFAAPSGSGKTTIVRHLLSSFECLGFSVSATTRPKRSYEKDGRDYYFLSVDDFKEKIRKEEFVEWEEVYENRYYGTLKSEIERKWEEGKHILFDIDVKGAMDIKKQFGDKCLAVFVKPPGVETLIKRLEKRNTETAETLKIRIARFNEELTYEKHFDTVLINDKLDLAFTEAEQLTTDFLMLPVEE
jgi:guanylate kinase